MDANDSGATTDVTSPIQFLQPSVIGQS
jgi:hypothetical protein